jgi:putative transposase
MARPLRLEFPNAIWHITARGNERKDIFRDDADRERFVQMLGETVERFGWRLLKWVLMGNHYHLLVQTPQPTLSRGMHWLNCRYAIYFNNRHKRCGHLFGERFHGKIVQKESHLRSVLRYVALNPVRAGIVERPEDWSWSSYRQIIGLDKPAPWLAVADVLENFSGPGVDSRQEYFEFVNDGIGSDSPWKDLVGQIYLGTPQWIEELGARINTIRRSDEHPRAQLSPGRPSIGDIIKTVAASFDVTTEQLASDRARHTPRMVTAFLAFEHGLHLQTEIAFALRMRGRGGVGSMIRRCRELLTKDSDLRELVVACRSALPRQVTDWNPPPMMGDDSRSWFRPSATP